MCFSARASFGAAAVIGGIGLYALRRAAPEKRLLAAMPILFAAQQLTEGMLWIEVDAAPFGVSESRWALAFLAFALLLWPFYTPLALAVAERSPSRRRWLSGASALGLVLGGWLYGRAVFLPSNACYAFGNLYYWVVLPKAAKPVALAAYLGLVAIPFFVSTVRGSRALGWATIASFAIAGAAFRAGFASVWCFFAALIGGIAAVVASMRAPAAVRRV